MSNSHFRVDADNSNLCVKPSAKFARWWQKFPGNNTKIDSEKGENEQLKDGTSREA